MQTQPGNQSAPQVEQGLVPEPISRMQRILIERIDRTRDALRQLQETFSELRNLEDKIAALESELKEVRKTSKEHEIRARKLEADNIALRKRIANLEKTEDQLFLLQQMHQTAVKEVGRTVKALLPRTGGSLWRKNVPLSQKAKLLISKEIVDPVWYLERHPDVAAAGMDPAVHYVLHGADEGRVPNPALDELRVTM